MVSAVGGASGLVSVRQTGPSASVGSGPVSAAETAARPVQTGASGGAAGRSFDGQTTRTVLAAQEQRGGGQAAASSAATSDTLTPFEALLDTNGDGVIDWRDYVSSEDADAIQTPSVTGYTSTGGAASAPAATGQTVSVLA